MNPTIGNRIQICFGKRPFLANFMFSKRSLFPKVKLQNGYNSKDFWWFCQKKCRGSKFRKILILTFHEKNWYIWRNPCNLKFHINLLKMGTLEIFFTYFTMLRNFNGRTEYVVYICRLPACMQLRIFPSIGHFSVKKPISAPFDIFRPYLKMYCC